MITKQSLSREIIFLFLLTSILWVHCSFIFQAINNIGKDDCSFNPNELFLGVLVIEIICNIFLSFSFIASGILLLNFDNVIHFEREDKMGFIHFCQFIAIFLSFINSILTNVTFFKSDYLLGKFETCSNIEAEIAYRMITFSYAWILFLLYIAFIYSIIYVFVASIGIAIKESNLCPNCSKCFKFFSSLRKVRPINISANEKNIQTENEVSIPITSIKNDIKPFTCMVCMNNMIDVIIEPCHHICICNECVKKLSKNECPCCNHVIKEVKNIYIQNLIYNICTYNNIIGLNSFV